MGFLLVSVVVFVFYSTVTWNMNLMLLGLFLVLLSNLFLLLLVHLPKKARRGHWSPRS